MPACSPPFTTSRSGSQLPRPISHTAHALEDGLVIVDHETDQLIVLNATARLVWQWLVEGADFDLMANRMAACFFIPRVIAVRDIEAVYAVWAKNGLFKASTGQPALPATQKTGAAVSTPLDYEVPPVDSLPYSERTYFLSSEPFRLRFQTAAIEASLHPLLAHLEVSDADTRWDYELRVNEHGYVLLRNRTELQRDALFANIQGHLVMEILQISYTTTEWLAVAHAGAVSDGRRAVLMPASSGSGKSTLTAALVHSGLRYFGDDIIPLRREGRLAVPFPTRIGLKEGSWPVLAPYYPELESSPIYSRRGMKVRYLDPFPATERAPKPVPVCCLVFPKYDPVTTPKLTELSALKSLQRFIEARLFIGRPIEDHRVKDLLDWISSVRRYALCYSDLGQARQLIQELLAR